MRIGLRQALAQRVLVLDGAMATMLGQWNSGSCPDAMVLTDPDAVLDIHRKYIEAGADIIETNSFSANLFSLAAFGLGDRVSEINESAALLARKAAGENHYVAGAMGPIVVSLSAGKDIDFGQLIEAYSEQARGLIAGGVDALLIETVFDTRNVSSAIAGAQRAMIMENRRVEIMISATPFARGWSPEEFITAIAPANPLSVGLNCGFGPALMIPVIERMQSLPCYLSLHANAGLPDKSGLYHVSPRQMSVAVNGLLLDGKLNIIGGCCGTTPAHIRQLAEIARLSPPRTPGL